MRFAKLGQTKPSDPTGLGMRRPLLLSETGERKSYAIDRPPFLILFEVGQIENEMHKINRGRVPFWFKGCSPYRRLSGLTPTLLDDLKKAFSSAQRI